MMKTEYDATILADLKRIADTAGRVPANPPQTFYEALNTIWFMKELMIAMEGVGMAIVGHLDRVLLHYYERDLAVGRITREEAKYLMGAMLAITDSKWDLFGNPPGGGVNTTVVIGGCDQNGELVFNDLTRIIIECYMELKLVNPKLQARISSQHPDEYFELLSQLTALGMNVLSIFNDEVLLPAHVSVGKDIRDARLYVAGGCQEPVLANCEMNVRANCYINLPAMINSSLNPGGNLFWRREGLSGESALEAADFEEFYQIVIHNTTITCECFARRFNSFQECWPSYSPLPLYSTTIEGCIDSAKDLTEGGAKYNFNSLSPTGIGTMIDSLYAIKTAVFEEGKLTLVEMKRLLQTDYAGAEDMRQYLQNAVTKFGDDDTTLNEFAGRVIADVAAACSGMPNIRGGIYEPSLFSNMGYLQMRGYDATADGRRKGETLSRGVGSSDQSGAGVASKVIHTLGSLPLNKYPASAVLYLDMPCTPDQTGLEFYKAFIHYFIEQGGNVLDINVISVDKLKAAKENPEQHKSLVVRVWGFSAYFVTLAEELQDEIIARKLKQ